MLAAMLRGLTTQRLTAMPTIELRGDRLAGAITLRSTLADLLDRLYARDSALEASHLKALVVTDDIASVDLSRRPFTLTPSTASRCGPTR